MVAVNAASICLPCRKACGLLLSGRAGAALVLCLYREKSGNAWDSSATFKSANRFMMGYTSKLLLAGSLLVHWVSATNGQAVTRLLAGGLKAEGVTLSFHADLENPPAVTLKVERVYTDYARKGFYRIGILPLAVLEGVTIQVHHPEFVTNSLAAVHTWIGSREARRLEMRNVSIVVGQSGTNLLQSGRGRVLSGGRWELFDSVRWHSGTNQITASKAMLQVTGSRTGELIWSTNPIGTNHLFASSETSISNQKAQP